MFSSLFKSLFTKPLKMTEQPDQPPSEGESPIPWILVLSIMLILLAAFCLLICLAFFKPCSKHEIEAAAGAKRSSSSKRSRKTSASKKTSHHKKSSSHKVTIVRLVDIYSDEKSKKSLKGKKSKSTKHTHKPSKAFVRKACTM